MLIALVPVILSSYSWLDIANDQSTLTLLFWDVDSHYFGWPYLREFVWQVSTFLAMAIIGITLLIGLARSTHWIFILLVTEFTGMNLFYLIKALVPDPENNNIEFYWVTLSTLVILTLSLYLRYRKLPTWRERHDSLLEQHTDVTQRQAALIKKVKNLNKNQISNLMVRFVNIKAAAGEMKNHHNTDFWRHILLEEAEAGDEDLLTAYEELSNV